MTDHRQELFDKVSKHLLTQGERAVTASSGAGLVCCYRTEDGLMCAVGCLIDDKYYHPEFEGVGLYDDDALTAAEGSPDERPFMVRSALEASLGYIPNAEEIRLLQDLQSIHDVESNWIYDGGMAVRLQHFATYRNLIFNG